jgi:acetyl esterase/lipase
MAAAIAFASAIGAVACSTASATAPPIYKGISYGPSPGEKGTVFAAAKPGATVVVLVHGGGWRTQTNEIEESAQAKSLQLKGFTVFDINYDQDSPTTVAFPLEPAEVETAIEWIIARAAAYNGNASNVVLLGGSSGGQLVATAAEALDASAPGTVRGVVSLSGPYDLQLLVQQAIKKEIKDLNYIKSIGQALGCASNLQTCSSSYEAEWSPDLHIPETGCPTWLLVSSVEVPSDTLQAEVMLAHLNESACPATFKEVPKGHGFYLWGEVSTQVVEFIRAN